MSRRTTSWMPVAMPESISNSTLSSTPRAARSSKAKAMSKRFWPATPRRMLRVRSGVIAHESMRL